MGDPFSVTASVAGLLSLGIQVSQSLIEFYNSYKGQDSEIARIANRLESLETTFQTLEQTWADRTFRSDEQDLCEKIERSVHGCEELILELQNESQKFDQSAAKGIRATITTTGRRLAYPFRPSTLQKLDEDIGEIRDNLSLALGVLQLKSTDRVEGDISDIKSLLNLVRLSQISQTVRDWLKAPDAATDHNDWCAKRHPATGVWLVKGPTFTTWLEERNSFLWLNGFAGCGKSVLCSTAIQHVFQHRRSDPRIGIALFYFTFKGESKQDASAMLRALLFQLSNQVDDGHTYLVRLHASYSNGVPPIPVLIAYLRQLIQRFNQVYLMIDAVDESPKHKSREGVLDVLEKLREWSVESLHLLVTSRDEPDIRECLHPSPIEDVSMKNAGVDKDIADYIQGHLEQHRALRKWSKHHVRIREVLTTRAKGVFRWVECQFQSLKTCPRSEDYLERLLTSLPDSLDETYERMLCNIDRASIDYARRILTWLCFAKRPLTVKEVIDGIAIDLGDHPKFDRKRRLEDEYDILQICPGFLSINDNAGDVLVSRAEDNGVVCTLSIAHYSVQEYLESDRIRRQKSAIFSMQYVVSNAELAQMCLTYLLHPDIANGELSRLTLQEYPLSEYAAEHWFEHYQSTEERSRQTNSLATVLSKSTSLTTVLFKSTSLAFLNWTKVYDADHPYSDLEERLKRTRSETPPPVYYASLLGLKYVLSELIKGEDKGHVQRRSTEEVSQLDTPSPVNAQGGFYGSALQAASYRGHEEIVELLLSKGADVNAQGGEYGNALQAASAGGHEKTVELLLSKSAEVNAQGGEYRNALQAASHEGHEKIVELLLSKGADVNAQGGVYGNALQATSYGGHEKIMELLLSKGADVNAQGGWYGNALQAASYGGHEKIVELLLSKGAEVNAQGGWYGNALQAASDEGHEKIMELLLSKGADVNAQGGWYGNALQAASAGGHEKIMELLLSKGADVNAQGGWYGSALQAASYGGHEKIMELVLSKGAEVNAQGGRYRNALQAASYGGHEKIIELLLNKGAEH